ncbi:MAG TPA: DNA mismatch repair endonuclease MutL [Anaerolineaceae bacterium]|nr:DNA mismatch repair endonuclease MutL [Anaerolineaceae bacterium]
MPIKILPDTIASQIAAGEVVDRPASVVKELLENAIDAGAQQIEIEILQAGRRLIQVTDDGSGIPADEVELAVCRHATSKLSSAEDLFNIRTLGFRGEALASIGSVSHLTMITNTHEKPIGAKLTVEGGESAGTSTIAAAAGTRVSVEDLFFNLPARLKFLKSDTTENRHITGLVTRYALAYPHIRWSVTQDEKPIFQTTGSGERFEILQALFGPTEAGKLMPVSFEERHLKVEGFISSLSLTRSNRKDITVFVNGRWVQDPMLTSAVIRAYNTMLMVGRYPVAVLFINISPELVDVNVHPAKAEVRFRDQDAVFSGVQRAIRRGLLAFTPIPDLNATRLWGRSLPETEGERSWQQGNLNVAGGQSEGPGGGEFGTGSGFETTKPQPSLPGSHLPLLRLVGQVASTYLIAEGPDGLYLIDQHAAHERVLFDQLMAQFNAKSIPSQALLDPVTIELTPEKSGILEQQLEVLTTLGFEIENFGPNTFVIRSVPIVVERTDPRLAIEAVVNAFEEDETPLMAEVEARLAARVCKRMAVKAGQILSEAEQRNLLLNLESSQSPRTCPHGRPTMIHLSVNLLERQFGRQGAL